MTIEEFEAVSDLEKKSLLVDANKLSEREDAIAKYEIFQIDDFYVEVSLSVTHKFRRILRIYKDPVLV